MKSRERLARALVVRHQSISTASSVTCSIFSVKNDASVKESGLSINERQGIKEENRELKLHIAKLQSELLTMSQRIEDQKATVEKEEEELQASRNKQKMLEDYSSLLALHALELDGRKQLLENK